MQKKIEIYSTPTCHFCALAKAYFKQHGYEYIEYDVASDLDKRLEMVEKSGQMGVPVIVIDGDVSVGYIEEDIASKLSA